MFNAKITEVKKSKINVDITVEFYKDGALFDTETVVNVNPPDSIFRWIKNRIQLYQAVDSFNKDAYIGDVDLATRLTDEISLGI